MCQRKYTDAEIQHVVDLYNLGYGVIKISRIVDMSESYVEQVLEGKYRRDITGGRLLNGRRPKEMMQNDK